MTIPQKEIDDLLERVDIVSVISAHVPLKKAGNEYKACCPFHSEKTPSFHVNPTKRFYYCFGCGESGSALTFLMKKAGLSFHDAVDQLARSAGVEPPASSRTLNGSDNRHEAIYGLLDKAMELFQGKLKSHKPAQKYLTDRGITRETALEFSLGYAPDAWDTMQNKFCTSSAETATLELSGMLASSKGRSYDRFRNRLMFPIFGNSGKVVGFGGRTIADAEPKYLNSPETPVFEKGRELFGLPQALPSIRKTGRVLVVEGYFDVLALHEHGIRNVVAALGTSVTSDQVGKLFRYAEEIVLVMDGDDAGRRATGKAIRNALPFMEDGRQLSVITIPGGHDPDTAIRQDPDCFDNLSDYLVAFDDFLFEEVIYAGREVPPERSDELAKAFIGFRDLVAKIPGDALRGLLAVKLAATTGLDVQFVQSQISETRHGDIQALSTC